MMKKFLSGLIAIIMVFTLTVPVYAADITSNGGQGTIPVNLTAEVTTFSVTVPTGLPVNVSATGEVTVSQTNNIVNKSFGPIEVKSAKVTTANGWTLKDYDTDFTKSKVNAKEFGFQLNGENVMTNGNVNITGFTPIYGGESQNFTYNAKVAPQANGLTQQIANVIFTIGWNRGTVTGYEIKPLSDVINEDGTVFANVGDRIELNAVAQYGTEKTYWSCQETNVVNIEEANENSCIAHIVGPGSATVNYENNGKRGSIQFVCNSHIQSIDLEQKDVTLEKGQEIDLKVIYNPSNTTDSKDVVWSVNDEGKSVVTVVNGHVTAIGWGDAIVTANVNGHTAQCVISVPKIQSGITITEHDITIENGMQHQLKANASFRAVPQWSVQSGNSVKVDASNGMVTAIAPGTSVVKVTQGNFSDTCTIHVTQKLNSISLNKQDMLLTIGQNDLLNVIYNPNNTTVEKDVKWSVIEGESVSIENGKVTATGVGVSVVQAQVGSCVATCKITVIPPRATGLPINKNTFRQSLGLFHGDLIFSKLPAPSTANIKLNNSGTVVGEKKDDVYTVYSACGGGGIFAPEDCSFFFLPDAESSFRSIDFSGFDTSNVTNMSGMFLQCKLEQIDLSNFNTSNVTNIAGMFQFASSQCINLSGWNTSKITNADTAFLSANAQIVDLSTFDASQIHSMKDMFKECNVETIYYKGDCEQARFIASGADPSTLKQK